MRLRLGERLRRLGERVLPRSGAGRARAGAPRLARCAALLAATLALGACSALPSLDDRPQSVALASAAGTPIHDALAPGLAEHPGLSGFYSLNDGEDAFAARIALVDAAVRTLDVQYYIWHDDVTGRLMFDALWRAAERGVRVRLLLDDNNTAGLDPLLAGLDAHPNVEVRLFNPFRQRSLRLLGFLTDFARLNRRMHNKSITADGAATIVGGRNIGDEYFDAGGDIGFVDLDVVAVGPIVADVARSFDAYWSCDSSHLAARLLSPPAGAQRDAIAGLAAVRADPRARRYLDEIRDGRVMRDLVAKELPFEWARARLLVDDPAKGLGKARPDRQALQRLGGLLLEPARRELVLVSPYFVPGRAGTASLAATARRGVQVRVLTNALESTDVAAVHSGYAKRRRALLRAGVELWELRRDARDVRIGPRGAGRTRRARAAVATATTGDANATDAIDEDAGAPATGASAGRGTVRGSGGGSGRGSGSSEASLHAKTFAVDGERIFVGSLNLDPRSALHNTELGVLIDSPRWALRLSRAFDGQVPRVSYRVQLDARGHLEWVERRADGSERHYHDEPNASAMRRLVVTLLGLLPIEGLL